MGRKPVTLECPRGVSIREFKHEQRIQIAFSFRGTECRELLPLQNITKSALTYAAGLRTEILRKITDGEFLYTEYFPDSTKAKRFENAGLRTLIGPLLDAQLATYEKQVKAGTLSPSTLAGYKKALNSERMKVWRDKTLADATPSALRTWISDMNVTAKFTRNLLTPLRSVFEDALNDDLITFDPFDRIALTKLLKQTAKTSEYQANPFTADEREAILNAARADEWPMIQFWFNAGPRPGEMIAMKWPKVNLKAAKVRIDLNQVEGVEKPPKTAAGIRDVDLNTDAIAALRAQEPISKAKGAHVWLNPATGEPWANDAQIRKTMWVPLLQRSGVRYRNPYQARHTYASAALTAGANPWYLADQLGHEDATMVFTIYGKFISEDYKKPKAQLRAVS
ncbi:putative prophage phiRv2 integrase [compost metagenome]